MKPNILIGLPAYRDIVSANTTISIARLIGALVTVGIDHSILKLDRADIAENRNAFATIVHLNANFSHLLMIDADMKFEPSAVLKMLKADVDVIACACPQRREKELAFNVRKPIVRVNDEIAEIGQIGTGIILIKREALNRLASDARVARRSRHVFSQLGKSDIIGFFDNIFRDDEKKGEDISFCLRWSELCGGKIFAVINEEIGHRDEIIGSAKFSDFMDQLT